LNDKVLKNYKNQINKILEMFDLYQTITYLIIASIFINTLYKNNKIIKKISKIYQNINKNTKIFKEISKILDNNIDIISSLDLKISIDKRFYFYNSDDIKLIIKLLNSEILL
jgi:hypothetical protein